MAIASVCVFLLLAVGAFAQVDLNANAFCRTCSERRNTRDLYEHPNDCHQFYQCFFTSETEVVGILHQCPPYTYFNIIFQACIYEGPYPCTDYCTYNATVNLLGCANIPGSCNLFIKCATGTELQCCPTNTRFDASICQCVDDATCNAPCTIPSPAVPTSVAPPTFNDTHCTDSFGNVLTPVPNQPGYFGAVDEAGNVYVRPCAQGSQFSLQQCRCDITVELAAPQPRDKQCVLYLPFDQNTADYSFEKFNTFIYGNAEQTTSAAARGTGSFSTVNGGRLEIPGTKNLDFQWEGTFCLFYNCPNGACPTGGLLSNNDNANADTYSIILASLANNNLLANFKLQYPFSQNSVSAVNNNAANGFNQVCAVYNARNFPVVDFTLYVNNQFAARTSQNYSMLRVANCPYTVGTDQRYGDFAGYLDEVLICPFAFNDAYVDAHYQGQARLRELNLIP